ncbi:MAG: polysaccharide biosynthesis tyrosine autokinase [Spirulina sp. SIO3F2]|nr:polysaccharide biosynthesis tyrosine autokinase [Spirulina sp. SIO3F2]
MVKTREQFDIEINVQQILLILKRRWPLIMIGGAIGALLGGVPPLFDTPIYIAGGTLKLVPQSSISVAGVSEEAGLLQPTSALTNPLATELLVLKSRPILRKVIEQLDLKDPLTGSPMPEGMLGQDIDAEIVTQTDAIRIRYTSERPQEAADVVNLLMETYIRHNIKTNREKSEQTRKFIENQLPGVKKDLSDVELALRRFKERHKITSLERETIVITNSRLELERDMLAQQRELLQLDARLNFLNQELGVTPEEAIAANALAQSGGIQSVYNQLQNVEQELATQQARFTEQNPTVQALLDQKQRLEALLNERIERVTDQRIDDLGRLEAGAEEQNLRSNLVQVELSRLGVAKALTELEKEVAQNRRRSEELPRLEQEQRQLERQLQTAQVTYETLLAGLQEAQLKENQEVGNARIVSEAVVPTTPVNGSSLVSLELIAGGILGSCLGLSLGMLLELLDRSLRTEYEARSFFKRFPVLGTIPAWSLEDWELETDVERQREVNFELPLLELPIGPDSLLYPVSVAYRRLQTNLKLLNVERRNRIIALTSSVPGEGKSATAANLALMLANLSHRVLLLEADLSAPQQHKIWKLSNIWGLSNILQDQIVPEQTIQSVSENLDVLSAGVGSPGVVALLDSDRMATTVRRLAEIYDYVIVDAPSLLVAPEIVSIGQIADGLMLVVRPGVLNKTDAASAQETLSSTGMEILGVILNGVVSIPLHTPTDQDAEIEEEEPDTYITVAEADTQTTEVDRPVEEVPVETIAELNSNLYEYEEDDAAILALLRKEAGLDDDDDYPTQVEQPTPTHHNRWSHPLGIDEEGATAVEPHRQQHLTADQPTAVNPRRRTSSAATLDIEEAETVVEIKQSNPNGQTNIIDVSAKPTDVRDPSTKAQDTKRWLSAITRPWDDEDN